MKKMTERVEVQFTPLQIAECKEAAEKRGLKLAAWIRMVSLRASVDRPSNSNNLARDTANT